MPATAQRPKVIVAASSPVLVVDVTGEGVRGVLESSALLVIRGILNEMSYLVDLEVPSAETCSRVYI